MVIFRIYPPLLDNLINRHDVWGNYIQIATGLGRGLNPRPPALLNPNTRAGRSNRNTRLSPISSSIPGLRLALQVCRLASSSFITSYLIIWEKLKTVDTFYCFIISYCITMIVIILKSSFCYSPFWKLIRTVENQILDNDFNWRLRMLF